MAKKKGRGLAYKVVKKQAETDVKMAAKSAKRRSTKPRKKALLIGINDYKAISDLRGCLNDVKNIGSALEKYCGFAAGNIKTLTDANASTAKIKKGITDLLAGAIPGDVLFLHYSGHGSRVPDKNGDETDGWDEILCSWDLDWNNPVLDDWLRAAFETIPSGVNLTVVFDSCHSGTATRKIVNPFIKEDIERYVASPWELGIAESGGHVRGRTVSKHAKATSRAGSRASNVKEISMPDVMISGCRDDQTSADAYIRGSYNGALSYNLAQAIQAKRGKLSYRELHTNTLERVADGGYAQIPQLSGKKTNLDREFLAPYA
jgi:hypothetical protein